MLPLLLNLSLVALLWAIYGVGAGLLSLLLAVSVAIHTAYLADKGQRDIDRTAREARVRKIF